jgi:putative ABC transport system permease protein
MSFAPRVMLAEADLAGHRPDPAGQPRHLPLAVAAPPTAGAAGGRVREFVRWAERASPPCRCAACGSSRWKAAAPRCSRRWTAPRSSSTSWRCWRRCWRRWRWASRRATSPAPPRRLRDAARAGPVAAAHRRRLRAGVRPRRPAGQRGRRADGLLVHNVFVWLLAGLVEARCRRPGRWPALFGLGVGMTLLLGFGLPPVLQLARVPPLRVIRRDVGGAQGRLAACCWPAPAASWRC